MLGKEEGKAKSFIKTPVLAAKSPRVKHGKGPRVPPWQGMTKSFIKIPSQKSKNSFPNQNSFSKSKNSFPNYRFNYLFDFFLKSKNSFPN